MGKFQDTLAGNELLQQRIAHSKEFLADVRAAITKFKVGQASELLVFAAGSLGRFETGRRSDLDLFLIARSDDCGQGTSKLSRLSEIEYFADLIRLNENLELPRFSGDGRYLKIHPLDDLIRATGSPRDDSENLFTTRILLLLESQWLSNDKLYKDSLAQVASHYFRDKGGKDNFQPLFLLNDLLRYWRTICLNYEQDRSNTDKPWWKKNLNLKFSRKLTVFSTVLALVTGKIVTEPELLSFVDKVPLERLAFTLDGIGDDALLTGFAQFLDDYESFLAAKSHSELEEKRREIIENLRGKAAHFGAFMHSAFESDKLNKALVQYVMI